MTDPIKVLCILGPTATGKTELALHAAKKYAGEIINVDSAQVYKGMDIGTAKLDANSRSEVPHHLFDIRDPTEAYSAASFTQDASRLIHEITARGKLPILAGGTMLYFKALFDGLAEMPAADETFRMSIAARAKRIGWPAIHQELHQIDPVSAERIRPSDPHRIQRAMEVHHLTGKSLTTLHQEQSKKQSPFQFLKVALVPGDRSELHQIIEQRLHQMIDKGFIQEVRQLIDLKGFDGNAPAMRAVGYRQMLAHVVDGEDASQALQKAIYATRQLAKRQLTWLRKMPELQQIEPYSPTVKVELDQLIEMFLVQ